MIIKVTRGDIRDGDSTSDRCPIAHALNRETLYEWDVLKATAITIRPVGWRCLNIRLSRSARRFIKRFDAGKPVVPFSFRISMTPWSNKAVRQCIVCNRDGAFLVRVFGPLPGMPKDGEIRKCLVCDDCAMDHFRLSEAWKRSVI